jgi:diguanylate cyclase
MVRRLSEMLSLRPSLSMRCGGGHSYFPSQTLRITTGLSVVVLYVLLGVLGLTLAIPPGYASPVFPAAGLALAVTLVHGRKALPFVWLGSLALNLGLAWRSGPLSTGSVLAAGCIALGASLQAWTGQYAVNRRLGLAWQQLETEGQIVALLLRGGVLACLVSASVAVGTLWALGVIAPASTAVSWWTWYLGDLLGVAVFAPLALLVLAPMSELSRQRRHTIVLPISIALALSVLLYVGVNSVERRQVHARVEHEGGELAKLIHDRLITHQAVLSSLTHFIEVNPTFSRRQFEQFTQAALADNPDIFALSFNDVVPREKLATYEAEISKNSPLGAFHATERGAQRNLVRVGDRAQYVIVRHIVPLKGNEPAVGFDIYSDAVRRDAIERSRASGKGAMTAALRLVQEDAGRVGVLMLEPVYRTFGAESSQQTPAEEPMGYAVAVLKVDELIGIAVRGHVPQGLKFQIRDSQMEDEQMRFYGASLPKHPDAYRHWDSLLKVADRQWTIEVWAEDAYVHQNPRWLSWAAGVLALLFTVLLQIYLHGMTGNVLVVRRQNQQLLEKQAELQLAETVFDNTAEAISVTDAQGVVISVNPAFSAITGYSLDEVKGRKMNVLNSGHQSRDFYKAMWHSLLTERQWQGEVVNRRKNGELYTQQLNISTVCDDQGMVVQYVGTFSDITEKKAALQQIEFMAYHDALTSLPNRLQGEQRAQESMMRAHRYGYQVAVLFMDLDQFKLVNDTYGHSVGDQLLQAVANRLRGHVRAEDMLCRISGDEFMLILEHLRDTTNVAAICEHLLAELAMPYQIDGLQVQTSVSIGIAMYPGETDGDSVTDLLRKADTAMFEAKKAGRNTYRFFDAAMNHSVVEFVETRDALVRAIQNEEFELYYQPQVRLKDRVVVGAEALLRWRHPDKGVLGPGHFISVAEQSGSIVPIGAWVLRQACRQMKAWVEDGLPIQTLAVNLSAVQFRSGDIEKTIVEALEASQLSPSCLELELTESILISDKAPEMLVRLKERGLRLSIDDFGTGYSSMAYLKRLKVDKLKIDASFAAGVGEDPDDTAIAQAIVKMAQTLGLETTAEGVEKTESAAILREMGCNQVQGYVYARPMPAQEFSAWVRAYQQRQS